MLAPSTVMPSGTETKPRPSKLFGPRQMPAPAMMSMASVITRRMPSVR